MFDKQAYRETCARLTLGTEKLEEMIAMTENTNNRKYLSRPIKTVLIAAACVAALCVTAFAAPALQNLFFTTYTVTMKDGDSTNSVAPVIQTYNEDGHNYLVVDDETIDITEALEKDGSFKTQTKDGSEVHVNQDGWVSVSGNGIDYTFNPTTNDKEGSFSVDGEELTGGEIGNYIVTEQNGEMEVTPAE